MDRIEEPPRIFYLDGCSLYYIFHNEETKEDLSNWDDHCEKKLVNLSFSFDDTAKFNWKPLGSFENWRIGVFVTVSDNPSK